MVLIFLYMSIIFVWKPGIDTLQIPKYSKKDGFALQIKESNQTYEFWKVLLIMGFSGSWNKLKPLAKDDNFCM